MISIDRYQMTIEELAVDGRVSLGRCSRSTAHRWNRTVNERLAAQKYPWRVLTIYSKHEKMATMVVVPYDEKEGQTQ